jgi:hypothetical protein
LYRPDADLNLGPVISTLTVSVDQTTYDTITWCRGDEVVMDEIRFGPSYSSVLGTTAIVPDLSPPAPDPMQWAAVPVALSPGAITMTAAAASDPAGVEYHFTNLSITDGSHDSGWQDSPSFTDTGLAPSKRYAYQVKARDKSPAANQTSPSAVATAVTQNRPDYNAWAAHHSGTDPFFGALPLAFQCQGINS